MGFIVAPFSPHSAAWKPGEAVRPQGSGNRCVVFPADYVELLGDADPHQPTPRIQGFLARHEGAQIICFESDHLAAVEARFAATGIATSGILPLQREVDGPHGRATARFERLQFNPGASPEGYIQVARHLTPELIYQPQWCAHPNGARRLLDTVLVVDDLAHFARLYADYLGFGAVMEEGRARFTLPSGQRLVVLDLARGRAALPGSLLPPPPCIAAMGIALDDVAGLVARLEAADIAHHPLPGGRVLVPAEACGGAALVLGPDGFSA